MMGDGLRMCWEDLGWGRVGENATAVASAATAAAAVLSAAEAVRARSWTVFPCSALVGDPARERPKRT